MEEHGTCELAYFFFHCINLQERIHIGNLKELCDLDFSKLAHKSSDKIFMLPKNLDLRHKLLPKESYMKKYLYEMRAI